MAASEENPKEFLDLLMSAPIMERLLPLLLDTKEEVESEGEGESEEEDELAEDDQAEAEARFYGIYVDSAPPYERNLKRKRNTSGIVDPHSVFDDERYLHPQVSTNYNRSLLNLYEGSSTNKQDSEALASSSTNNGAVRVSHAGTARALRNAAKRQLRNKPLLVRHRPSYTPAAAVEDAGRNRWALHGDLVDHIGENAMDQARYLRLDLLAPEGSRKSAMARAGMSALYLGGFPRLRALFLDGSKAPIIYANRNCTPEQAVHDFADSKWQYKLGVQLSDVFQPFPCTTCGTGACLRCPQEVVYLKARPRRNEMVLIRITPTTNHTGCHSLTYEQYDNTAAEALEQTDPHWQLFCNDEFEFPERSRARHVCFSMVVADTDDANQATIYCGRDEDFAAVFSEAMDRLPGSDDDLKDKTHVDEVDIWLSNISAARPPWPAAPGVQEGSILHWLNNNRTRTDIDIYLELDRGSSDNEEDSE